MIFFLVMPALFGGFGNYFVPIFQGSPEVVYPRVNNFSIIILSLSYLFVILSLISEFGGGIGWTLYPPLSTSFMSISPSSIAYLIFGNGRGNRNVTAGKTWLMNSYRWCQVQRLSFSLSFQKML
jgi:heme/copper-type cytochrome/quinol oxidase subunit 1